MLKGALIGFGQVAEKAHAPAWQKEKGVSILAAADARPERRAAAEKAFPGIRTYADFERLLEMETDLDFVDIATPPHLHAAQCRLALQKGRHVLCEKPLVLNRKDFAFLRDLAQEQDRALFTTHNWKHAPLFIKLRSLLDADAIGAIRHMEWHTLRTRPAAVAASRAKNNWRTDKKLSGGGILLDHGWHAFYLITWLLDAAPKSASAALRFSGETAADRAIPRGNVVSKRRPGATPKRPSAENEATCLIEFPHSSAVVHLTWNAARRSHWGILEGARGTIEILDDRLRVLPGSQPPHTYVFPEPLSHGSAHPDWFSTMLGDFRAAVANRRRRTRNLKEAELCIELIERIYRQHGR